MFCERANNLTSYMSMNQEVYRLPHSAKATPWDAFREADPYKRKVRDAGYEKVKLIDAVVGIDVSIEAYVELNNTIVGDNASIGTKSRLKNVVVMEGVHIGSDCTIQNCVLARNVTVNDGCKLTYCNVGKNYEVTADKVGTADSNAWLVNQTIQEGQLF